MKRFVTLKSLILVVALLLGITPLRRRRFDSVPGHHPLNNLTMDKADE